MCVEMNEQTLMNIPRKIFFMKNSRGRRKINAVNFHKYLHMIKSSRKTQHRQQNNNS